jgi:hypothetical protein
MVAGAAPMRAEQRAVRGAGAGAGNSRGGAGAGAGAGAGRARPCRVCRGRRVAWGPAAGVFLARASQDSLGKGRECGECGATVPHAHTRVRSHIAARPVARHRPRTCCSTALAARLPLHSCAMLASAARSPAAWAHRAQLASRAAWTAPGARCAWWAGTTRAAVQQGMATVAANEVREGELLEMDGGLWRVVSRYVLSQPASQPASQPTSQPERLCDASRCRNAPGLPGPVSPPRTCCLVRCAMVQAVYADSHGACVRASGAAAHDGEHQEGHTVSQRGPGGASDAGPGS